LPITSHITSKWGRVCVSLVIIASPSLIIEFHNIKNSILLTARHLQSSSELCVITMKSSAIPQSTRERVIIPISYGNHHYICCFCCGNSASIWCQLEKEYCIFLRDHIGKEEYAEEINRINQRWATVQLSEEIFVVSKRSVQVSFIIAGVILLITMISTLATGVDPMP
jgi:hypothetical protein